jgi:hypothetical protein
MHVGAVFLFAKAKVGKAQPLAKFMNCCGREIEPSIFAELA